MTDMFKKDAKDRGVYVGPMSVQILNKDGSGKETRTFTDEGEETIMKGGDYGIPPGAPGEFIKAQAENIRMMEEGAKNSKASVIVGNRLTPDSVKNNPGMETSVNIPRKLRTL
jgi:hypothetical protein